MPGSRVLTINGGSSSIKFGLFAVGDPPCRLRAGIIERIGLPDSQLIIKDGERQPIKALDYPSAADQLIDWLVSQRHAADLAAVGHRVVHGGSRHGEPQPVTAELLDELRRLSQLDPAHLPGEIALIESFVSRLPGILQIACFDTAFHHNLPRVAQLVPIPRRFLDAGIRRFGFHGLSYAYLLEELARVAGTEAVRGRIMLAHLGNGASMAAVRDRQPLDTTMGFTPTGGLVMGTRSGDLDPGLLVHLMRTESLDAAAVDDLVNRRSGLVGVSGSSPDMRDLLAKKAEDPHAAEAVELFCFSIKKAFGAFAAVLGGLDTLVFAGGIGENAPEVRARACAGLEFLGIHIDPQRNAVGASVISPDGSPVTVRVIRTDEEQMIAREVFRLLPCAS